LIWWPQEDVIRYAGLGLQLAGIGTVWWGIRETRKLFDHPSFLKQVAHWWGERPRYGGRVIAVGMSATAAAVGSARGFAWNVTGSAATLDQRIEALEKNLERVRDDLSGFQKKTEDDVRKQEHAIKQEQQARRRADQEIQEKLKATETGGLHISAMGAVWLLAGVAMGTIPDDLASWFG